MANRVSNQAMAAAAAAPARDSVRHTRKWWAPAKVEANPTMLAINTNNRKVGVATFPANQSSHREYHCNRTTYHGYMTSYTVRVRFLQRNSAIKLGGFMTMFLDMQS